MVWSVSENPASLLFAFTHLLVVLTKRTVIGNVVGGIITAIGVISLVMALGIQESNIDETVIPGGTTAYQFDAPAGTLGSLDITGDNFDVSLMLPGQEEVVSSYDGSANVQWLLESDGVTRVAIQNTGQDDLHLEGTIRYTTDPILYTYHVMVIVAGVVIIGFSAGFSVRKPKGF